MDLRVQVDDRELEADWVDNNPKTRAVIEEALPQEGEAVRWGDELYFRTAIDAPEEEEEEEEEDGRTEVSVGDIAYWPEGNALCLFWGTTPASEGDAPAAASPVNVVAELADVSPLAALEGGAHVRVERD